ncbi:MAG TPA: hypothetical protein VIN08_17250 [Ohtaekwangia sp.]|uniref:hypothetical protein n=1 Tax=Ohtaekwangia sp. TaxID=2066019 RepID=UPI002F95B91B
MTKNGEESEVTRCLLLIESQLGWGASEQWVNYDFEKLSDTIHESTGVRLSITTLKRIWGKLKYDSAPTLTTLNALAKFAGYTDWRTFKQQGNTSATIEVDEVQPAPVQAATVRKHNTRYYWLLLLIPFALLGYALIPARYKIKNYTIDSNLYSFRADKMVTEGVPNSVVFHYNAEASPTDSVFIAQTWDLSRKVRVPKNKTAHSAIYYYPGYFRAKLLIDTIVVKTHDLWITSGGWLCLAENNPVPLYFTQAECIKDSIVEVNESILKKYNLSLHPKAPRIRFFNQRNLGDLMSDNFTFETKLQSDFNEGTNVCQPVQVLIQCKDDIIIIPFSARSCVGDLQLAFCGTYVTSKDADLSRFGADLTQWTKLRIETVNKHTTIYINDQKAYSFTFPNDASNIVGIQYRFNGVGAVKDTWFENKGKVTRF